ncbi:MAG: hypothetical protein AB7O24_02965 [Kofleriaceae bacterium]
MPDLILRLRVDPVTGKREIVVDYTSEADALPIEHEDEHRRLAGKVVDGGLDNDKLSVTREGDTPATTETPAAAPVAAPIPTRK